MTQPQSDQFSEVIDSEEALLLFLRTLKKLESNFCRCMREGIEFTAKMEVVGNKGVLLNCRVNFSEQEQPKEAQKRLATRLQKELEKT